MVSLGSTSALTLEEARKLAQRKLGQLAETGRDPFAKETSVPFSQVAADYLSGSSQIKASTRAKYEQDLRSVNADLGHVGVDVLDEHTVAKAFEKWTRERGRYAANQGLRLVQAVLKVAVRRRLRSRIADDMQSIARHRAQARGREISPDELQRIGTALDNEQQHRPDAIDTIIAIRLLLLTGARRREITNLRWDEVDLNGGHIRLEDSKTGRRDIALGTTALQILASLPRTHERVFPAHTHEVGYAIQYTWKRVLRTAGVRDLRLHDCRHHFVTRGLSANYSEALVGRAVGHRSAATTRRYSHMSIDPVREVTERMDAEMAAALEGRLGELVKFPSR